MLSGELGSMQMQHAIIHTVTTLTCWRVAGNAYTTSNLNSNELITTKHS